MIDFNNEENFQFLIETLASPWNVSDTKMSEFIKLITELSNIDVILIFFLISIFFFLE